MHIAGYLQHTNNKSIVNQINQRDLSSSVKSLLYKTKSIQSDIYGLITKVIEYKKDEQLLQIIQPMQFLNKC